jgi:glycosyltransferase involved in cell wall biosynthesis
MFAAVLSGVPFSFTAHAKDIYTQDPERLRDKLGRAAFAVTCTGANLDYLARLNDGGTPIHRVYHGIDADYFTRSAPAPAPPPYRVLSVARLTPKKGLDTVLRALGLLRDRGLDLTFTLIGDGEERDRLRGLVRDLGLEGVTEWLGPQARDAVRERMAAAHVFALGCRVTDNGDRDGIPNVLAEAMAMELPVVATSVSAIPELVEPGRSGLLVPPDDPAAMAVALERALTDPALRARLARAGRDRVEREFDNRALIGGLAGLFKARLGSGAVSGEDPAGGQAERAGRQLAAAARPAWRP